MLDQHVARILFCGLCVISFSSHADFMGGKLDSYSYDNFLAAEFGGSKYATAEEDTFYSDPSNASVIALHMSDGYKAPSEYNNYNKVDGGVVKQTKKVRLGLKNVIDYLRGNNLNRRVAPNSVNVSNRQLADTASALMKWQGEFSPETMKDNFYFMELRDNNKAQSKFTGYYTPTVSAQLYSDAEYRYPIYKSPMSNKRLLSRKEIVAGGLANQGFEIAWTNDPLGLFYLHIQGSGVLQFANGKRKSLKFDGTNGKPFRSIARYMQNRGLISGNPSRSKIKQWLDRHPHEMEDILNINPRFIYFTLNTSVVNDIVKTASGMPVVPGHTIAVDTKYIPFGSVILAEVPIINSLGQVMGNEWRVLFSQDRGDAIKGPARMDIYTGAGESARKMANNLTGYGKAYLLLSKPEYEQTLTALAGNNNQRL